VVKRKIPAPRRESNPRTPTVQPVAQRYTDGSMDRCVDELTKCLKLFDNVYSVA